ncbi:serine protease [Sphaerisporangium siamense]|uniref:Subtilisin family serine protease n=1 Tax=Sphaerisporangium siamense TaxID=795645 RepID=A0A7W7DBS3_9ACTN|nr:S8 family serine peptidase [Sphaerisporangium siamense]MBB4703907.1 subtilisin family serine protease [Sphaerisporangium siamense]GII82378.1 serine protease [Sphaerisporangium siamense]
MQRLTAVLALAALTALSVPPPPATADTGTGTTAGPATSPAPVRSGPAPAPTTITLITGDRVTVPGTSGDPQGYRVTPGAGRKVTFSIQTVAGHTYVLPSDAKPLIDSGLIDRRLFNVTQLVEWGYDDAHTTGIPVLTKGGGTPRPALAGRTLASIGLKAAKVPKSQAATVWQRLRPTAGARTLAAGVSKLWLDGGVFPTLDRSVPQVGAPVAWQKGLTGKGVTVAVVDSGYDPNHPDLKGVVTQAVNFTDAPDTMDELNHGTGVASAVAGSGAVSGGKYRGVAPDVKIAVGKVLKGRGNNLVSDVVAGMEWAARVIKAPVINVSLGMADAPGLDPMEEAVNRLSEETGSLFVVGAGNEMFPETIYSPGSADAALTVGMVDHDDNVANNSSQGPRVIDKAVKPDITAPGVEIVVARSNADGAGLAYEARIGTSLAAPHVSGAAAILAQQHPGWNRHQLKAALIGTAKPATGMSQYRQGAGRLDVARAVSQGVTADTGNLWTYLSWPHHNEEVTEKVTYTNATQEPVTLTLTEDGPYTLSADHLTVPAGGDASVTLTFDRNRQPGVYTGTLTATAGDLTIRSLTGAYIEPEAHTLALTIIGRDGLPATEFAFPSLINLTTGERAPARFVDGVLERRLAPGEWNFYAEVLGKDGDSTFIERVIRIDSGDLSLRLDARLAQRISLTVDDPAAKPFGNLSVTLGTTRGQGFEATRAMSSGKAAYVLPDRLPGLKYVAYQALAAGGATPSRYDLVDQRTGEIPFVPAKQFKKADLAKVSMTFRAQNVDTEGRFHRSVRVGDSNSIGGDPIPVTVPGTIDNYLTPGQDMRWSGAFTQPGYSLADIGERTVQRGQSTEVWNTAVTGPAAPRITRYGDDLDYSMVGLFSDGDPGRTGWDGNLTGTAALLKDGTVLQQTDLQDCDSPDDCSLSAQVPAAEGAYTVNVSARRDVDYAALSTAIDTSWTFTSAHTDGSTQLAVPSIRYAPQGLDVHNRAKPGSVTEIPITAHGGKLTTLRLEASFDDGTTWQDLQVRPNGESWTTSVTNPTTAGHVTLRATATGPGGVQVKQTITRAYAVQN